MDPTLAIAIYGAVTGTVGAVTGTVGAVVAIRNRYDVTWGRRAKITSDLRPALAQLRDAVAEAKLRPQQVSLRTPRTRVDLDLIKEITGRAADRKLRQHLHQVHTACSVVAAPSGTSNYSELVAVEDALNALNSALKRLDKIDRRAPK